MRASCLSPLCLSMCLVVSSAGAQGSRVEHLSPGLHPGSNVEGAWFTPGGGHLCFVADLETDEAFELWCASVDAPTAVQRIGGLLPSGSTVEQVGFSADGAIVYFVAPLESALRRELFAAPVDGSALAQRLGSIGVDGGGVVEYEIHASAGRVLYRADAEALGRIELYSAPLDGQGAAVRLNGALVAGGDVLSWQLADDGTTVVYRADQQTDNRYELYAVAITGGTAGKLSGPITAPFGSVHGDFQVADGHVLYRADPTVTDRQELWSAPLAGGPAVALAPPPVAGGDVLAFSPSPDGSRVAFTADDAVDQRLDLYTAPVDGSAAPVLLAPGIQVLDDNAPQQLVRFSWTADGAALVAAHQQGTPSGTDLWRFPALGGPGALELDGNLSLGGPPLHLAESGLVLAQTDDSPRQLFCVADDGPPPSVLTAFTQSFTGTLPVDLDAAAERLALAVDDLVDDRRRLFTVDLPAGPLLAFGGLESSFRGLVIGTGTLPSFAPGGEAIWALERHVTSFFRSDRLRRYRIADTGFRAVHAQSSLITQPDRRIHAVLPSPVDPDRVAVISEGEADERLDLYLVTVVDAVFADGFGD